MPGTIEWLIDFACILLEVSVVVCAVRGQCFRRYFFLNLFMTLSFLADLCRYQIIHRFSAASREYFYFYYYSDALLTIGL